MTVDKGANLLSEECCSTVVALHCLSSGDVKATASGKGGVVSHGENIIYASSGNVADAQRYAAVISVKGGWQRKNGGIEIGGHEIRHEA